MTISPNLCAELKDHKIKIMKQYLYVQRLGSTRLPPDNTIMPLPFVGMDITV